MGGYHTFWPLTSPTLNPPAAPKFTREPSDVGVDIGSNVTLVCLVQGYPEPQVTWRREDGLPLFNRPRTHGSITQSRGGLHITGTFYNSICAYMLPVNALDLCLNMILFSVRPVGRGWGSVCLWGSQPLWKDRGPGQDHCYRTGWVQSLETLSKYHFFFLLAGNQWPLILERQQTLTFFFTCLCHLVCQLPVIC